MLIWSGIAKSQTDMIWFVDPLTSVSFQNSELNISTTGNRYLTGACFYSSIAFGGNDCGLIYFTYGTSLYDGSFNKIPSPDRFRLAPTASYTVSTLRFDNVHYAFTTPRRTDVGDGGLWVSKIMLNDNCGVDTVMYNIEKLPGDYSFVVSNQIGCCDRFITAYDHSAESIKVFPVTEDGVQPPITSYIGLSSDLRYFDSQRGGIYYSPNMNKVALSLLQNNTLHIYDFDIETKTFEFSDSIRHSGTIKQAYGAAFSPNGRMLYVVENSREIGNKILVQYDLSLELNDSNRFVIADLADHSQREELIDANLNVIYIRSNNSDIGIIRRPNERGDGSMFLLDINDLGLNPPLGFSAFGCAPTPSIIRFAPQEKLFQVSDTTVCPGVYSFQDDRCFTDYQWVNSDISGPDIDISESGSYILEASYNLCSVYDTINITVQSDLEGFVDYQICRGDTLFIGDSSFFEDGLFTDTLQSIQGCDSIVYIDVSIIDVGLGDTTKVSIDLNEIYSFMGVDYSMPGIYELLSESISGCDSVSYLDIDIKEDDVAREEIYIANVFSPNNDGVNDALRVEVLESIDLRITDFTVYDRYGMLQYQVNTFATSVNWDGRTETNVELNPGVYIYKVSFVTSQGIESTRVGDVTLLR